MTNCEVIRIKKESYIYIDQFHVDISGYGISFIEALAYGNIVLASIQNISEASLINQCGSKTNRDDFPIIYTGITKESLVGELLIFAQSHSISLLKLLYKVMIFTGVK